MKINPPETYLIIDGYSIFFRAYYGIPPILNEDGININAIYGTIKGISQSIKKVKHDKIIITLDSGKKTFRNDLYQDYKANRTECPDDLKPQFSILDDFLSAIGIANIRIDDLEADDIIATYAIAIDKSNDKEGIIITYDKDLNQLITDKIAIYRLKTDTFIHMQQVIEEFGVKPNQIADYLALVGDTSDNIPGVKGIGPKNANDLLNKYQNIEEIYQNLDQIPEKNRKILIEGQGKAFISYALTRLQYYPEVYNQKSLESIETLDIIKHTNEIFKTCDKYKSKILKKLFIQEFNLKENNPNSEQNQMNLF